MTDDWVFDRGLDDGLRDALVEEARQNGWWRDVLHDQKLVLAPRSDCLDVYWKGQRLFQTRLSRGTLRTSTHAKYLLDPETDDAVELAAERFQIERVKKGFMRQYDGRNTLELMKRAAAVYSDSEKSGVHDIAMANPDVIDVEVTFAGSWSLDDGMKDKNRPRIDLVSLEPQEEGAKLVFWEAKLFSNPDLWSSSDKSVVRQIEFYRQCLRKHGQQVATSYKKVANDHLAFEVMSDGHRQIGPLTRNVANGAELVMNESPDVRLLVFDFDESQIESSRWKDHRKKLLSTIQCIQTRGSTRGMKLKRCL